MIEQLYETLWPELTGWCASMSGDRGLAEELVQEAFLRAMAHEADLAALSPAQQRAWLYRTVKNLYLDHCRRAKRFGSLDQMGESGFEPAALSAELNQTEWLALLETLPDIEGVLFFLRYLQGYPSPQLGQMFSLPPGTVRSKLASARKHLKEMIGGR